MKLTFLHFFWTFKRNQQNSIKIFKELFSDDLKISIRIVHSKKLLIPKPFRDFTVCSHSNVHRWLETKYERFFNNSTSSFSRKISFRIFNRNTENSLFRAYLIHYIPVRPNNWMQKKFIASYSFHTIPKSIRRLW